MDKFWRDWLERYANDEFYWYQPKGFAVNPKNLPQIRRKLAELNRFVGRPWRQCQSRYARRLQQAGLYTPTRAEPGSADYAAIVRMNKEVFDSLGLAWVSDQSIVVITAAGERFLASADNALPAFVHEQLCRYQYPNPAVGRSAHGAGVFPYAAILSVLTHFRAGFPVECYELFIARMRSDDNVQEVVELIRRFQRLSPARRNELTSRAMGLPLIRQGRVVLSNRRTGLHKTIRLNRSYMLSVLKTPGIIIEANGVLRINPDRHAEAEGLVQSHLRTNCYIQFENAEDWVAFYGEIGRCPTYAEALAYYMRRGAVERSSDAFEAARARRQLPDELRNLDAHGFRRLQILEKTLEDFLEFNLHLIESGLQFVARQYSTPTGPLDILARDRESRWVVIELKRGRAADRVVGQLLRYRGFILQEKARGDARRIRAFVVAPEIDDRVVAAARGALPVSLEVYEFVVRGHSQLVFPAGGNGLRPLRRAAKKRA